ncbi:DUF2125 domain-containing protein, partial [Streptomyces sp. Agncl-13]|uniref:DUF2125 domain-containing protein n=1 Tax=Streptomyces sp. Agncl-13 TaxID=3400628 RepID=UPI003A85ED41
LDGELQMTVTGLERVIPALGIEKMLEEGVPQATLDRIAPGVKSQDLNNLFGALDRAVPGLGKVIKQNANAGLAAGINSIGTESTLEGRKARSFPLKILDGTVLLARAWSVEAGIARVELFAARYSSFIAYRDRGRPEAGVVNAFAAIVPWSRD